LETKLVIPVILSITIIVAGIFAFSPIEKATTIDSTVPQNVADIAAAVADLTGNFDALSGQLGDLAADHDDLDADVAALLDQHSLIDPLSQLFQVLPCPSGFVQIAYHGHVTSVSDTGNLLNGNILNDDSIRGSYCYDPDAPDTVGDASLGAYVMENHSLSIGDDDFTCGGTNDLRIRDNVSAQDSYEVFCFGMLPSFSATTSTSILQLQQHLETHL